MGRRYFGGVVFTMKENYDLFHLELEIHTAIMEAWWSYWQLLLSLFHLSLSLSLVYL